jgi:AraC-like DNA-binding protein
VAVSPVQIVIDQNRGQFVRTGSRGPKQLRNRGVLGGHAESHGHSQLPLPSLFPAKSNTPGVQSREFDDPDLFSVALQNVNLEVTQAGEGDFRASLVAFETDSYHVQMGSVSQRIVVRGATRKDRIGILIELRNGSEWRCFGRTLTGAAAAVCSGGHDLLLAANADTDWVFISVAPERLAEFAQATLGRRLPIPARGLVLIKAQFAQVELLRTLLEEHLRADRGQPDPTVRDVAESAMLSAVLGILTGRKSDSYRPQRSFIKLLRQIDDIFSAIVKNPIDSKRLDSAMKLATDGVAEAFYNGMGISLAEYLKIRRLGQIHKALLLGDPRYLTVQEVARAWGILDLGRFNREFKTFFKKSSSEVLRESSTEYRKSILSRT